MPGLLTLIGSGETAAGMAKVHRQLLGQIAGRPQLAFIDTPAGFELGIEAIGVRFVEYFDRRFGLPVAVVHHRRAEDDPEALAAAMNLLGRSNYILAGPGSPSYAARQWRRSSAFGAVVERWQEGAQLVLASSAAIAVSRHVLPVYEIYKVGEELHWVDGVDLLGPHGFDLAIVTHWDNAEGGTHDTSACFMGRERMARLRTMLPSTTTVLGIDEHTACTINVDAGEGRVRGRGGVTILRGEEALRHPAGTDFPLSELVAYEAVEGVRATPPSEPKAAAIEGNFLEDAAGRLTEGDLPGGLRQAAQSAEADMAVLLHQAAQILEAEPPCDEAEAPLLDLLVEVRAALRQAKQWKLADVVRDRLAEMGYQIRDTPDGTVWEKG